MEQTGAAGAAAEATVVSKKATELVGLINEKLKVVGGEDGSHEPAQLEIDGCMEGAERAGEQFELEAQQSAQMPPPPPFCSPTSAAISDFTAHALEEVPAALVALSTSDPASPVAAGHSNPGPSESAEWTHSQIRQYVPKDTI